jgi:hypothetical protein
MPKSRLFAVVVLIGLLCVPVIDPNRGHALAAVITALAALVASTRPWKRRD